MTAKMIYVLYPIDVKATGVIMTTMKLNAQFADVDKAFAGALIRRGTISAGYSHVIPNHPTAKKELKMKRKSAATMPGPLPPIESMIARMIMEKLWPAAPKSIN